LTISTRAPHLQRGERAEDLACEIVKSQGHKILFRNFRCKLGELDIVTQVADFIVIIEVKYRAHNHFSSGLEQVTAQKQRRIIKATQFLLSRYPHLGEYPIRFDVIAFSGELKAQYSYQYVEDAFQAI